MDCTRDCVRRVGKFTKLCHYMLVLDQRSLYFSLTPEDDLGLVKSLKVGRAVPDLVYDVGVDIQSYVHHRHRPLNPSVSRAGRAWVISSLTISFAAVSSAALLHS
jgi:hypothetical protein